MTFSNPSFQMLQLLVPELLLSGAALLLLALDAAVKKSKWPAMILALVACVAAGLHIVCHDPTGGAFGMLAIDSFSNYFKILALGATCAVLLISEKDDRIMLGTNAGTYCALILLSVVGTMLLASAQDLLLFFVALELTTIPLFILTGFLRDKNEASEGALKFFVIGAFSAGLTLYGISYLYGICGSTHFHAIQSWWSANQDGQHILFFVGVLFMFIGMAFKFSLVPFHQWTPDAYQGAPISVTAFFSVSREAGIIAVFLRFFSQVVPHGASGLTQIFMVISILTMFVGNLSALKQNNVKRLLAYSSIAHAGTIFIGIVAGNALGIQGVLIYSLSYLLMSLGAFAALSVVLRAAGSEDISALKGLSKTNFCLAVLLLISLLSLAGIPPLFGFWGKLYVFYAAIQAKMYVLVFIGLINSVIAVYYYFRMVHAMFFDRADSSCEQGNVCCSSWSAKLVSMAAAALLVVGGVFPETIIHWVSSHIFFLP